MKASRKLLLRSVIAAGGALPLALAGSAARADDDALPDGNVDKPAPADDTARRAIDRSWLYVDDARVAAPMAFVGTSNVSYTSVGNSPSRLVNPFPGCTAPCNTYNSFAGNTATPGGMIGVGGEVGLLDRVSVMALAQVGLGGSDNAPSPSAGAIAGLRVRLSPSEWQDTHLVLSGGYLREAWQGPVFDGDARLWHGGSPGGDSGAWVQAAFSTDIQRLRLAATAHGEHVFSAGRDPLDVMVQLGASYRVAGDFRAGLEYVGQDLEETFSPAAEGGGRHFLGPIASLQVLDHRLTMVAGPSVGLTWRSPDVLGRFALSYAF